MTTRPEIAFEDLPVQSEQLTDTAQILVSVGGTERRATVDLLPTPASPTPAESPTIEQYDVTGDAAPAAGSIAGDSYGYTVALGHTDRIAVARIVGFAGTAPHPAAVTVIVTLAASGYTRATGTVAIPSGVTLAAGASYTLRLQVFAVGQRLTDEPAAYSDYRITAPASGGGLNQGQVDARVRAIVEALYRDSSTDPYPDDRIPTTIARVTALAGLQTADQVHTAITSALTDYRTQTQIAAAITAATAGLQTSAEVTDAIAAAGHVRDREEWVATATYAVHDLVSEDGAWYLAIAASTPSDAAAARPGSGTAWQTYWVRLGSPIPPGQPTINQYDVTGDAAPAPRRHRGRHLSLPARPGQYRRRERRPHRGIRWQLAPSGEVDALAPIHHRCVQLLRRVRLADDPRLHDTRRRRQIHAPARGLYHRLGSGIG